MKKTFAFILVLILSCCQSFDFEDKEGLVYTNLVSSKIIDTTNIYVRYIDTKLSDGRNDSYYINYSTQFIRFFSNGKAYWDEKYRSYLPNTYVVNRINDSIIGERLSFLNKKIISF